MARNVGDVWQDTLGGQWCLKVFVGDDASATKIVRFETEQEARNYYASLPESTR